MKKVINYKVQKEELEEAKEKAFKKISSKYKVDGFRPGKAPRNLFEKNYPGKTLMEAADELIDKEYKRLILEEKIMPILEPKIDVVKLSDDEIEVNYTFILEPTVKLGKYKKLGIKKEKVKATKEEVQARIDDLLKDYAELVVKDDKSKVEDKDIAIIDFEGFKDGIAFDGGKGENYSLEIGSHTFIPGFEEGIIGMKKDETKDLKLTFPKDYGVDDLSGKEVVFKVKVNEIKNKVIPELNKDFFEDLGMENIKNEEDLRKEMTKEIENQKEKEAERKYNDALLEKACETMEIELDDELVTAETEAMYKDFMDNMAARGVNEELYLKYANTTKEDILSHMKEEATKRLKNSYLLDAVIKEEKIKASDKEIKEEVSKIATEYNMTEEDVKSQIGGERAMKHEVEVRKALEIMKGE